MSVPATIRYRVTVYFDRPELFPPLENKLRAVALTLGDPLIKSFRVIEGGTRTRSYEIVTADTILTRRLEVKIGEILPKKEGIPDGWKIAGIQRYEERIPESLDVDLSDSAGKSDDEKRKELAAALKRQMALNQELRSKYGEASATATAQEEKLQQFTEREAGLVQKIMELERAGEKHGNYQTENAGLQAELEAATQQQQLLREECDGYSAKTEEWEEKLRSANTQIVAVGEECQERTRRAEELQELLARKERGHDLVRRYKDRTIQLKQAENDALQRKAAALASKIAALKKQEERIAELQEPRPAQEIKTPLEGVLASFSARGLQLEMPPALAEQEELQIYARKVLRGDYGNAFLDYLAAVSGMPYTAEELRTILSFDYDTRRLESQALRDTAVAEAERLLEYIRNLETITEKAPVKVQHIHAAFIGKIREEHSPEEVIKTYQRDCEQIEQQGNLKKRIQAEQERHNSFQRELMPLQHPAAEKSLPVAFVLGEQKTDIYFPFAAEKVSPFPGKALLEDLTACFPGAEVLLLDQPFLSYRLAGTWQAEQMIRKIPPALQLAGYTRITPITLEE